jgi:hypothetical protein
VSRGYDELTQRVGCLADLLAVSCTPPSGDFRTIEPCAPLYVFEF